MLLLLLLHLMVIGHNAVTDDSGQLLFLNQRLFLRFQQNDLLASVMDECLVLLLVAVEVQKDI